MIFAGSAPLRGAAAMNYSESLLGARHSVARLSCFDIP